MSQNGKIGDVLVDDEDKQKQSVHRTKWSSAGGMQSETEQSGERA
jgi:hypothetical protein